MNTLKLDQTNKQTEGNQSQSDRLEEPPWRAPPSLGSRGGMGCGFGKVGGKREGGEGEGVRIDMWSRLVTSLQKRKKQRK